MSINTNKPNRKTKIIATLGPATSSPEMIRKLIIAGVNVFRLNFSHGTHDSHLETLKNVRVAASELKAPIGVLQDLSGPKVRISAVKEEYASIQDGDSISLRLSDASLSDTSLLYIESVDPVKTLKPGERVLLADGTMELKTEKVTATEAICKVTQGGHLRSKIGATFPDSHVDLAATTNKDFCDLEWGIKNQVDYVAISFVSSADDIRRLRDKAREFGGTIPVIAKIERKQAIDHIREIIAESDGIMVARGDLGVEIPLEEVPGVQKMLIERANRAGIPVIVATQMLSSMITAIRPTRAEVSDIANAVMSGTDAVMLSEETAIGEHPIECVGYLSTVAIAAEKQFNQEAFSLRLRDADSETVPDSIAYACCAAAAKLKAAAIITCTESGTTARLVAKYRPQQNLYGVTFLEDTFRRLALFWGVIPMMVPTSEDTIKEIDSAMKTVQESEGFAHHEMAVVTAGLTMRKPGATSMMAIREF